MLGKYEEKRDFHRTPEPAPDIRATEEGPLAFVVHRHSSRRHHYDLRIEVDGVLKSWAVPHGPSLDPASKRLAVAVEDHPIAYGSFEGSIPAGEYGAGQVIVWDQGTYSPRAEERLYFHDRARAEELVRDGLVKGKLALFFRGHKLKGAFELVKLKRGKDWLLVKRQDEYADAGRDILKEDRSVLSGLSVEELKAGRNPCPPNRPVRLREMPGARKSPLPSSIAPMLATPTSAPFSDPAWFFEPKLDGFRVIAFVENEEVRLQSRTGLDVTQQYQFLVEGLRRQPAWTLVLDGEVTALDEDGRVCFQCLQQNLKLLNGIESCAGLPLPIIYYVFDVLYLDGYDLRGVPLDQRKRLLAQVFQPSDCVRLTEYFEREGGTVYESALKQGLEGVIAKRRDSVYQSGERSRDWLKVKAAMTDEFVVAGYTRGQGDRMRTFGALILGYHDEERRLVYAGHVGSGFDETMLVDLRGRLDAIRTGNCPFDKVPPVNAPATWVRPEVVVSVRFTEWTRDGILRAPVFLHVREDKPPGEVRIVEPVPPPQSTAPIDSILRNLDNCDESCTIDLHGQSIGLTNLSKELWPPTPDHPALTKRDLLVYLTGVSPYLLEHLRDRPLTLNRYPDGIFGKRFYQKHWGNPLPGYVETVKLRDEHGEWQEYLLCNNLATLLWLGQLANLEFHVWFSRIRRHPDETTLPDKLSSPEEADALASYPDFAVFDLDPYIYAGNEAKGAEPDLSRAGFARTVEVALWLKEVLDALSLSSFVKTSGKTGLHVYVPLLRRFNRDVVRAAVATISQSLVKAHPHEVTTEWTVEKRTDKVFIDYKQNMRGKTLASPYSPRPTPEATVSTPVGWDELGRIYPTELNLFTVPARLSTKGDPWEGIMHTRHDLGVLEYST